MKSNQLNHQEIFINLLIISQEFAVQRYVVPQNADLILLCFFYPVHKLQDICVNRVFADITTPLINNRCGHNSLNEPSLSHSIIKTTARVTCIIKILKSFLKEIYDLFSTMTWSNILSRPACAERSRRRNFREFDIAQKAFFVCHCTNVDLFRNAFVVLSIGARVL